MKTLARLTRHLSDDSLRKISKALKVVMLACIVFLVVDIAKGQPAQIPTNYAYKSTTLVAAAETVTIQQVTGSQSRGIQFTTASVECSVACIVYIGQNTTAATTTALATSAYNANPPSRSVAFSSSNAGSITSKPSYTCAAACLISFNINMFRLGANAASGNNFSIGTNAISGDVKIKIDWIE